MRILALDLGSKTIGVAVSDPTGTIAQGLETIRRTNLQGDFRALETIIQTYEVTQIIIGLPLQMNGEEGTQAQAARVFGEKLREAIPNVPIQFWDERLSTVAAERGLLEADLSRKKRKEVINHMAAAFILQGYLEAKRFERGVEEET